MFEETNQMMEESEELENLPENLFDDEEDASQMQNAEGKMQSEGDSSALHQDNTSGASEMEEGKTSGTVQSSEGERAPAKPALWEEGETADKAKLLADSKNEPTGESRRGGNHAWGITPPPDASSVLRVKYNGEERDISLDEARTLAQKGLNYDHVVTERDRNRSAFDFLMERAKSEGITVEQFIERERGRAEDQRLEAKMEEIRGRDDDASEETIKRLARLELEAEKRNKEKERETAETQALEQKKNAEIEGWNRLFAEHPELRAKEGEALSPEVTGLFELIGQGYTPVEAYYIKRSRELEVQNRMQADARDAKRKSIGSLSGNQKAEEEDDFLAGFNSI